MFAEKLRHAVLALSQDLLNYLVILAFPLLTGNILFLRNIASIFTEHSEGLDGLLGDSCS